MISWPAVYVLGNGADFLEIFSGCGHLTLGAARQGLRVGPSIDKSPGIGHDNAFSIDVKKAFDRKLVWALVVVLCPRWIHCSFRSSFWSRISHWTRIRDLSKCEMDRMEALLYVTCLRRLVYYQVSQTAALAHFEPTLQHGMGFGYCEGHDTCQQDGYCGYGSLRLGIERS